MPNTAGPRCRVLVSACAVCAALVSCGGGSGEPQEAPGGSITTQNVNLLLGLSLNMSGLALSMVRDAQETIRAARATGGLRGAVACAASGEVAWSVTDADASGAISAGDVIRIEYRACAVPGPDPVRNGEAVDVLLSAVPGAQDRLAGQITVVDGPESDLGGQGQIRLAGLAVFEHTVTGRSQWLNLLPGTRFTISGTLAGRTVDERMNNVNMVRSVDAMTGLTSQRIDFDYNSALAGAQVEVRTSSPLAGDLQTYPHTGLISIRGGKATQIDIQTGVAPPRESLWARITARLSDTPQGVDRLIAWTELVPPDFFWADGIVPRNAAPDVASERGLRLLLAEPSSTAQVPRYEWVFSRPLDVARTGDLRYRMHESQQPVYDLDYRDSDWAPASMSPALTITGTRVLAVAPGLTQLGRGGVFEPVPGPRWVTNPGEGPVWTDIHGASLTIFGGGFSLPETLRAIASYATPDPRSPQPHLLLTARKSDLGAQGTAPIVSYRWSQVSGPALRFLDAGAADTRVESVGPWPEEDTVAVIDLEITNAAGEVDRDRVPVLLPKLRAAPPVAYFRSSTGSWVGAGRTRRLQADDTATVQLSGAGNGMSMGIGLPAPSPIEIAPQLSLRLGLAAGTPLVPGVYGPSTHPLDSLGGSPFGLSIDGSGCGTYPGWRVEVFEYTPAAGGGIETLAADFDVDVPAGGSCGGSKVYGSVRINSARPIRP